MFGTLRKLVVSLTTVAPARARALADVAVDPDVGAAEPVDRLLRVADDEEAARDGRDGAPVGLRGRTTASSRRSSAWSGSVSWNSSTKMCVKRSWKPRRTSRCPHEVARLQQQVEEVERALRAPSARS
jgi:hypothetical protein